VLLFGAVTPTAIDDPQLLLHSPDASLGAEDGSQTIPMASYSHILDSPVTVGSPSPGQQQAVAESHAQQGGEAVGEGQHGPRPASALGGLLGSWAASSAGSEADMPLVEMLQVRQCPS
jgi:hypothetical protein